MKLLFLYLITYSIACLIYIWYRYICLSIPNQNYKDYSTSVSVIIPFYNEDPNLLKKTILSIRDCDGDKEIIVVNDGSTDLKCNLMLESLKKEVDFKLISYDSNKGKRYAQFQGFEVAKNEIIVTCDSDTIYRQDTITELIKFFSDKTVGATTGQLYVLNKNKNLLTRIQSSRYWNAFNFERYGQGNLGVITCCCGAISGYRKSIIDEIKLEYLNQKFLGRECTYGDDRHLTTLILKKGYKIKYAIKSIGYTEVPHNLRKFLKQQKRWKLSYLRETFLISRFMFKKSYLLSFEVLLPLFIAFFGLFARLMVLFSLISNPNYIIPFVFMVLFVGSIHSLYLLFHKPREFLYSLVYGFFHIFVVYWILYFALFNMTNTKWGTR